MIMAKDSNNNYVKIEDIKQQNSFNGVSPIEFKGSGENLENYRIYGNTVGGESVGDRTGNLFDKNDPDILDDYEIQGTNLVVRQKYFVTNFISVNAETSYITNRPDMNGFSSGVLEYDSSKQLIRRNPNSSFDGFTTTNTTAYIKLNGKIEHKDTCMLVKGNTVPSIYEPYGYKVPVTVEGKNLLQNTATSQTINGVTFTVNNDGSITCNGTATASAPLILSIPFTLPIKLYELSGCPDSGSNSTYRADIRNIDYSIYKYNGNTVVDDGTGCLFDGGNNQYCIRIAPGYTCNNLTFYPMIRKADIEDDTYEPYRAPVTTPIYLPEPLRMVGEETEYVDYEEQKQHRVRKNLLQNTAKSQTINGVTFTVNSDGSVTCNGTSTSRYFSLFRIPCYLVAGEYIISGCPDGGDSGTYRADIRISPNGTMISSYMDIGVGATIVIDESGWYDYTIRIQGGYTVDNITFKPMIRKANIEDDTYEPYIENTDLDVTLPALPTLSGTNTLSVGTEITPSKVWGSDPRDIEYVKDNLGNILFSKYHEVENVPPLTYKAIEGTLKNYRIYGNTVGGESVGDRTGNLFDENATSIVNGYIDNTYINSLGEVVSESPYATSEYIFIPEEANTISVNVPIVLYSPAICFYGNDKTYISGAKYEQRSVVTESIPIGAKYLRFTIVKQYAHTIMLNAGSTALPYEPYGYKVPVTVSNGTDTLTTPIYLPEQIRKVGDEAEYISYAEQKQHRVRKNLFYITKFTNNNTQSTTRGVNFSIIDNEVYANGTPTVMYPQASGLDYVLTEGETYAATLYIEGEYTGLPYIYCTTTYDSAGNYQKVPPNVRTIFTALPDTRILFVAQGTGESFNIKYKLLITKATIEDDTYEPYIENTDINVTLPALPTLTGTNVLSVGTAVQPSEVYIKGKIKEAN